MAARPTQTDDEFTGVKRETLTTAPFGGEMKDGARVFLTLIHETSRDGKQSTPKTFTEFADKFAKTSP